MKSTTNGTSKDSVYDHSSSVLLASKFSDGISRALGLISIEELLLFRAGVVHRDNHLAGVPNLETVLHHRVIGRDQLPRLLHDHCVSIFCGGHKLSTIADIPA